MYFVPVRKIFKLLFTRSVPLKKERKPLSLHQCLEKNPESRQRYRRRWLLLLIIPACIYIVYYHESTRKIIYINHGNTSEHAEWFANGNAGHVVKKTISHFNDVNLSVTEQLANMKKEQEQMITTSEKYIHIIGMTENITKDSIFASSYKKIHKEPQRQPLPPINSPVCTPEKDKDEKTEIYPSHPSISDDTVETDPLREVQVGGYYIPKKCRSRHRVAILVPYRNREKNLAVFVFHMHPFLMRQQLEYRIFIIEQAGNEKFNRGKLFNVGFMEMGKYNDWHCVVLHDVDLLPLSDKILYTCPTFPRHMCGTVVQKAKLSYNQYHTLFGGVSALTVRQYKQINGFSNLYWGWGGEDNDLYWRILSTRLPTVRYNKTVAKYTSLPHSVQHKNENRYRLLRSAVPRAKMDGLSNLVYKVIWTKYRHLYTHILADVNPLKENLTAIQFLV